MEAEAVGALPATRTLIKVVEVWVPNADRTCLELSSGIYGEADRFGTASRTHRFRFGEELPGRVWAGGRPLILNDLSDATFRRRQSAQAAGLSSVIALPILLGEFVSAVMVLFCGADGGEVGAIELWNAPAGEHDMSLIDGYYGATDDAFEFASRKTVFRQGVGLPGITWQTDRPQFIEDLGSSRQFVRAESARRAGIHRGLAIPCPTDGGDFYVMTFLSSLATPIARRVEYWLPDASRSNLSRVEGFCEVRGRLSPTISVPRAQGVLGSVWSTGVPRISENAAAEFAESGSEVEAAGLTSLVAIPLVRGGALAGVVAWYF